MSPVRLFFVVDRLLLDLLLLLLLLTSVLVGLFFILVDGGS